jgi:hypothetical protein
VVNFIKEMSQLNLVSLKNGNQIEFKPTYKLAFLVQNNPKYERLAKLLVGSLGFPQVGLVIFKDTLPSEPEIFILFGDKGWCDSIRDFYNMQFSDKLFFSPTEGHFVNIQAPAINPETNSIYEFPQNIIYKFVPGKPLDTTENNNISRLSLYYTLKFIKKSSLCQVSDCVYGLALAFLISRYDPAYCYELLNSIFARDEKLFGGFSASLNAVMLSNEHNALANFIKNALFALDMNLLDDPCKLLLSYMLSYIDKDFFRETLDRKVNDLEQRIKKAKSAVHLSYYGIIALLDKNNELLNVTQKRLLEELFDPKTCYVKSSALGSGYCYSPLLSIFLILLQGEEEVKKSFPITSEMNLNLGWCVVNEDYSTNDSLKSLSFFDLARRQYSQSLIENLEKALFTPSIQNGYQFEISSKNYSFVFLTIQNLWAEFIKDCIHLLGYPCVIVSPWPEKKEFALSIRYDVDRPVTWDMIDQILTLQNECCRTACASWFFFADDNDNNTEEQKKFLTARSQEIGLHAICNQTDISNDVGITYHCGPNSSYWPGKNLFFNKKIEMNYTELLSIQVGRPLLYFLEGFTNEIWVTPLHFPMEKGTQLVHEGEQGEFLDKIKLLGRSRGHIILGSHPDIDQRHLSALLKQIDLNVCWFATIKEVVERCKKILQYGMFHIEQVDKDSISLFSQNDIENLQIKIISKVKGEQIVTLDVNAFETQKIPLSLNILKS